MTTVIDLIEANVLRHPDKTALLCGQDRVTYRQLWDGAHAVAERLLALGCERGDTVVLAGPGNAEFVTAALGAWLTGVAWVPMDPQLPAERVRYILDDTDARLVLHTADNGPEPGLPVERIRPATAPADPAPAARLAPHRATGDDTAYLIYTSGSTGRPKGVQVGHHGLAVHLRGTCEAYGLTERDVLLSFSSASFDAAVEEIWAPLTRGATVLLRGPSLWTGQQLFARVRTHQVTYISCTTAYFEAFFGEELTDDDRDALGSLRGIIFGGEAVHPGVVRRWANGPLASIPLCNTYGPTEAIVTATLYWIAPGWNGARVPIGHGMPGHTTVVLDAEGREAADGESGELYLGGPCVATGYLGRPDLTGQRFVELPGRDGVHYRTGDLVAVEDGELVFLGRADRQVKIRGFRIELEEVEIALRDLDEVRTAVVGVEERPGGGEQLVAHVVPQNPADREDPDAFRTALRTALGTTLPAYMVPAEIRTHERMPLGVTGKVDRAKVLAGAGE
ncbi:amino acid adenylation domain-containing protein [Streptomyces sp. NPDC088729]|uniref:amino acid adenylation domain-containing protein n=1 Tax=Streptomyces sp. NPDC088729 TaxID=3365876 RepID=UPI003817C3B6